MVRVGSFAHLAAPVFSSSSSFPLPALQSTLPVFEERKSRPGETVRIAASKGKTYPGVAALRHDQPLAVPRTHGTPPAMYWLDTAILAALGLGAGLGLINGFLWQVARLLSLSLALAGTLLGNAPVAELLREH